MKKIIFLFLLFLFSFQLFADDDSDKIRLAIMEIEDKSGGLDNNMLAKATEYLRSVFVNSNKFIIIPEEKQKDMLRKITKIKEDSYKDRYDKNFQINLGTALSADTILRTTISLFAGKYTVTSEIVNLSREATLKGSKETFDKNKNIEESLKKALDSIAAQIISNNNGDRQSAVSAKELKACQQAREKQRPSSWIAYLKVFPKGFCALEAERELDRSLCEHAKIKNTMETWQKYLKLHPDGECVVEAHESIVILKHKEKQENEKTQSSSSLSEDAEVCEYARAEDTLEAWQEYLKLYPNGECEVEALESVARFKHVADKKKEQRIEYLKGRKIGNLIWSDSSAVSMRWGDANQYCEDLQDGGFNDWRLPSLNEFNARIQNNSGSSCTLSNSKAGRKVKKTGNCGDSSDDGKWYWTSTFRGGNRWIFNLSSGGYYSHSSTPNYVICVRQP